MLIEGLKQGGDIMGCGCCAPKKAKKKAKKKSTKKNKKKKNVRK